MSLVSLVFLQLSTLRFATRMKWVTTQPIVNEKIDSEVGSALFGQLSCLGSVGVSVAEGRLVPSSEMGWRPYGPLAGPQVALRCQSLRGCRLLEEQK